jgi:Ca2+-binding EF-hand superfamily protein
MSYSDQQLKDAVNAVFQQFDKDNSGTLDSGEVLNLINAALKHMKANRLATEAEVQALIAKVDKNGDKKVNKDELLEIFKQVSKH